MMPSSLLSTGSCTMATSVRQSLTMARRLLAAVALAATGLLLPLDAQAEIILDDFDEPFEIVLPEMTDQPFYAISQSQSGVGPLAVERWVNFLALESRPIGRLDGGLSRTSSFNIEIERLRPTDDVVLGVGATLQYFFDEMDITQGGENNRVVVDFAYLRSAIPLPRVGVGVYYAQTVDAPTGTRSGEPAQGVRVEVYSQSIGELIDIPTHDQPFALEFPFDATKFDATRARGLYFAISPAYYTDIDEIGFSAAIEHIRITIPEPVTTIAVGVFAALICLAAARGFSLPRPPRLLATAILAAGMLLPISRRPR